MFRRQWKYWLAGRRYRNIAAKFRPGHPVGFGLRRWAGPISYSHRQGAIVIEHAIVLAGEWLVIEGARERCDAYVQTPLSPLSAYVVGRDAAGRLELQWQRAEKLPVEEAFLLGGCSNYAHWLFDLLPRIQFYRDRAMPVLVNGPLAAFQEDALRYLGIDERALICLPYPSAHLVSRLHCPALQSSITGAQISEEARTFLPEVAGWLRSAFAGLFERGPANRRIFISRADESEPHRRRLLNDAEIEGVSRAHGFEIVPCEKLSFAEQVALFSRASVIAGPHGAGFANMVFAPPGARLIEMTGPQYHAGASSPFARLAPVLGQTLMRLVGTPAGSRVLRQGHVVNETYAIDEAEFDRALNC